MKDIRTIDFYTSRLWQKTKEQSLRARKNLQLQFPSYFGLPIGGPLVQFYRNDSQFETHISLVNYVSFFLPNESLSIQFKITAYNQNGLKIGSASNSVGNHETIQVPLTELISGLDNYGLFSLEARYSPSFLEAAKYLGQTSPQFMTLFVPRSQRNSTQVIHSHKRFEKLPSPKTQVTRFSRMVEYLADISNLEYFVLNSGPVSINSKLDLLDAQSGILWKTEQSEIAGHSVGRFKFSIDHDSPKTVFSRLINNRLLQHQKPIVFRTFKNGITTCNHT
jgi:hypothetical protein